MSKQFSQINTIIDENTKDNAPQSEKTIYRLPSQWFERKQLSVEQLANQDSSSTHLNLDNKNDFNRQIGIFIHEQLKLIAMQGLKEYTHNKLHNQKLRWEKILSQRGIFGEALNQGMLVIEKALFNVVKDTKAAWIFNTNHHDAQSELALSGADKDSVKNIIIDRTFVDEENIRWIIDYKTKEKFENDLTTFKNRARQNHIDQLYGYSKIMRLVDARPIKLGLYYPLIPLWIDCGYYQDND